MQGLAASKCAPSAFSPSSIFDESRLDPFCADLLQSCLRCRRRQLSPSHSHFGKCAGTSWYFRPWTLNSPSFTHSKAFKCAYSPPRIPHNTAPAAPPPNRSRARTKDDKHRGAKATYIVLLTHWLIFITFKVTSPLALYGPWLQIRRIASELPCASYHLATSARPSTAICLDPFNINISVSAKPVTKTSGPEPLFRTSSEPFVCHTAEHSPNTRPHLAGHQAHLWVA